MNKRPGGYSKVPTNEQDEVIEMEQLDGSPDYYSTGGAEKQESSLRVIKTMNCQVFWSIIALARRLYSCIKVIVGVLTFFGVVLEGGVLYADHYRINSLIGENSTTLGKNSTTLGQQPAMEEIEMPFNDSNLTAAFLFRRIKHIENVLQQPVSVFKDCLFENEQCEIGTGGNGEYWKACPTKFVPKKKEVAKYNYLKVVMNVNFCRDMSRFTHTVRINHGLKPILKC